MPPKAPDSHTSHRPRACLHRRATIAAVLALTFAWVCTLAGCPTGSTSANGPVAECKEVGQQCRLEAGQLGVCTASADGDLMCASQH